MATFKMAVTVASIIVQSSKPSRFTIAARDMNRRTTMAAANPVTVPLTMTIKGPRSSL